MKTLKIYLSGSVTKPFQKNSDNLLWSHVDTWLHDFLAEHSICAEVFDPSLQETQAAYDDIFKVEMEFIGSSDLFLVELSQKRGLGVGVEMLHAKNNNVPIYCVCPDNGYYRRDAINWIHPFVLNLATKIFDDHLGLLNFLKNIDFSAYKTKEV